MADRFNGFSLEEADKLCEEHILSPVVLVAYPVTFLGQSHVHLELEDGDIVVFDRESSYQVEM